MMKKKIYLHIGFGKTGTSAIQLLFSSKRNELLRSNFLYPATGLVGNGHHALAPLGAEKVGGSTKSLYDQLEQEIGASQAENVIISSENLTFARPTYIEDIQQIFEGHEVRIVFYVRRQESLIESTFLEWQKVGDDYQGSLENFFRKHKASFDFVKKIAPWVNCFGEHAIIARLYDREVIGDDVRRDIVSILGINGLEFESEKKANISLRPEFSLLVGLIDAAGIEKANRTKIINELLRLSENFDSVKKVSLMSATLRKEIFNFYQKSNQEFSDKYLDPQQAALLCGGTV